MRAELVGGGLDAGREVGDAVAQGVELVVPGADLGRDGVAGRLGWLGAQGVEQLAHDGAPFWVVPSILSPEFSVS